MGFILSVIYFVISYMAPEALLGSLAQYQIELIPRSSDTHLLDPSNFQIRRPQDGSNRLLSSF